MRTIDDLMEELREVKSWQPLVVPPGKIFRHYGTEMLHEKNEVPVFNQKEHLITSFTGMVRGLQIEERFGHESEKADFAFLLNGNLVYTVTNEVAGTDHEYHHYKVSLRKQNFELREEYTGSWRSKQITLEKRRRSAYFLFVDRGIKINVYQGDQGGFGLDVTNYDPAHNFTRYGINAVNVELNEKDPAHQEILAVMRKDPDLFAKRKEIKELLAPLPVHEKSRVYFGFKDGIASPLDMSRLEPVIREQLTFKDAMKIAFPVF